MKALIPAIMLLLMSGYLTGQELYKGSDAIVLAEFIYSVSSSAGNLAFSSSHDITAGLTVRTGTVDLSMLRLFVDIT